MSRYIKTNISTAYWCASDQGRAKFEPAEIEHYKHDNAEIEHDKHDNRNYFKIKDESERNVSWFDNLFDGGGIKIPEGHGKPITLLISGPPGSGKTTIALELCLRVAICHGFWSLYLSTESETDLLIDKVKSLKIKGAENRIFAFNKHITNLEALTIYGQENIKKWETFSEILTLAIEDVAKWLTKPGSGLVRRLLQKYESPGIPKISPDIFVFDNLNMVKPEQRNDFFEKIVKRNYGITKLIIVVVDSSSRKTYETWEFACDNILQLDYSVIRLDATSLRDYYIRYIEVIKARHQAHVWGKHQMKIYTSYDSVNANDEDSNARMKRAHPYRAEGGIFIYPSIHFFLSTYKRGGKTLDIDTVKTPCKGLNDVIGGFPVGRCTALMGCRGGHKSHLGYLHILELVVDGHWSGERKEAGLIISLRDDEQMTKQHMEKILMEKLKKAPDRHGNNPRQLLRNILKEDLLEILYFPPGYITPDEFYHRMYMSIHRLKKGGKNVTLMFNSLDQISARFPLCAHQPIFVPAIIESLSGEKVTNIFIAVDEPGQPTTQYGLLPMADLILTFERVKIKEGDYYSHHDCEADFRKQSNGEKSKKRDAILLEVSRFSGGQKAGTKGLLELVYSGEPSISLYKEAGLYFRKWNFEYFKP
jgi:KaiC/GvpD/RAD55 family RecA-like ATPase